ncbi:hypothetical protein KY290_010373 [Solanum tuberosum]|uniref:Uncharacterized protein n=1 Tax=Solanum tuberosum TaxID=4113 RepID=A0ABQ7VYU7_SOLTU|nr:hypothetical protein KY284_010286 [Solanum tuberosum]KAH0773236.1 hypothetical protein KY290_010373 [Solanum tuberosum]
MNQNHLKGQNPRLSGESKSGNQKEKSFKISVEADVHMFIFLYLVQHVTVKEGGSTATTTLGPFSVEKYNQELRNCSRVSHIEHGINGVGEVEQPLEEENGNSLDIEEDDLDDVPD